MPLFTSSREKQLWIYAFLVFIAIYSTLFIGQPLIEQFTNQGLQTIIFLFVMILIGVTIILHSLKAKPSKIKITIFLGIIAVYIMFFLRLGLAERTHLIEYSVLAIFIHKAITERFGSGNKIYKAALFSFAIAFFIGVFDESLQIVLPNRVFDFIDILFNGIAVVMALGLSIFLTWFRS